MASWYFLPSSYCFYRTSQKSIPNIFLKLFTLIQRKSGHFFFDDDELLLVVLYSKSYILTPSPHYSHLCSKLNLHLITIVYSSREPHKTLGSLVNFVVFLRLEIIGDLLSPIVSLNFINVHLDPAQCPNRTTNGNSTNIIYLITVKGHQSVVLLLVFFILYFLFIFFWQFFLFNIHWPAV